MNARNLLLAVTFVLAVTETVDIVDTGIAAAVFAALFFACGAWFWRRGSMIAATILGLTDTPTSFANSAPRIREWNSGATFQKTSWPTYFKAPAWP